MIDKLLMAGFVGLVLFMLMGLGFFLVHDRKESLMRREWNNKLWQQCINDGHKEYECVAILRGRQ